MGDQKTTTRCEVIVGTHTEEPWAGHPKPCGERSVARHPGIAERWAGICRRHLQELEASDE